MNLKSVTTFLILSTLFTSCAYFNTFHNTKKFYKEAKKERENRHGDKPTSAEIRKYDQTIEKASKVLELYPNSKYVDDAVLILGECFYYKGDYVKAQRKFEELISFFKNSDYFDKAKLWLAKTNIKLNEYVTARFILEELIDGQKVKREIREEAQLLLGDIQFAQALYEAAKSEYQRTAENATNGEFKARAYFQLGQCQLKTSDFLDAVESFNRAIKHSPNKQFTFDAELNLGRALKLSGGFKQATKVCLTLLEREPFKDRHGLVKLEIADCIYREGKALYDKLKEADLGYLGKVEKAIDEYKKITLEYKRTDVSANAYFQMAKIYEQDFGEFATSKEYYGKVRVEYSRSELVPEAEQKVKDIGDLIRLKNLVKKSQDMQLSESNGVHQPLSDLELLLLEHGVHPELRFMKKQKRNAESGRADHQAGDMATKEPKAQDLDTFIANKLQLAETYLFQFGQIDSAIYEYNEIIELFPNHPGTAKALYTNAFIYENEFHNKIKTDSLLYVLIERFPDSEQAQEARKVLGILPKVDQDQFAFELYKEAEQALFTGRDPHKAIRNFRQVVGEYPNSLYALKALYAIGWIHEQLLFDNKKAIEIYEEILQNYPNSEYAQDIKKKLSPLHAAAGEVEVQEQESSGAATDGTEKPEMAKHDKMESPDSRIDEDALEGNRRSLKLKDELKKKPTSRPPN